MLSIEMTTAVIGFLGAYASIIRLYSRVSYLEQRSDERYEELSALKDSHNSFQLKLLEDLTSIRESLARLEGKNSK